MALAGLTALETARQPICLILTTTAIVLMILAALQAYQFGEEGKFVRDSALAIHFFFGLLIAAYAACTALAREFKTGVASAVLSKPVGRGMFYASKYAGIALVIALFSVCASAGTLLCEQAAPRMYQVDWRTIGMMSAAIIAAFAVAGVANYARNRSFASTALALLLLLLLALLAFVALHHEGPATVQDEHGHSGLVERIIEWRLVPASLLIAMALLVIAAIALALATRLDTAPVILLSCCILLAGLMSDYLFGRSATPAAGAAYRLVPNWQNFWLADALTGGGGVTWRYVGLAGLYSLLYAGAMLGIGGLMFRNREL